jgi:hypothetical protein
MAVQASGVATLIDVLTELDPGGKQLDIAEVLTQQNEILQDMVWVEGNTVTGHKDSVRTSLPEPSFRSINAGVPVTKAGSTPIEETAALLEDFSQVDRELAIMAGDVNGYRLKQARPHIQGMSNKMARSVFYANAATNPKEFTGLAPRFNTGNEALSQAAGQVIDAGGVGANLRSIWLVGWSEDTVFGIYPKGTRGGLDHEDATNATGTGAHGFPAAAVLLDPDGNQYMGYRDHWIWRCGLMVKDWRYVVRIANIDETALTLDAATGPNLQDLMVQALELIENTNGVRAAFYTPRTIRSYFRRQLLNGKNAQLSWDEMAGKKIMNFGEVPVRRVDALNTAETAVTGF